ncbi:hypothetical protein BDV93DRAFT_611335 [Ceratobasidium sp. AG-I]|nr:hypothetical protein BDV93DRAFT_611335 [Ceratobasidium sp. AG-I]
MDALRKWKAAKVDLTESLPNYLKTCADLESALLQPVSSFLDSPNPTHHISLENNVFDVYGEIPSIKSIESIVSRSHAHVYKIMNMSTSRVPIALLPPEILTHIFTLIILPSACPLEREITAWFIFSIIMLIASIRTSVAMTTLWGSIFMTFMLVMIGALHHQEKVFKAAGGFGILTSAVAFYCGAAGLWVKDASFFNLPVAHIHEKNTSAV